MKEYIVKRVNGKPEWSKLEAINIDTVYREEREGVSAEAKFCYDDDFIYARLSTTEPKTIAKGKDFLCEPCLDSCLEFFFSPVEDDKRYCNLEFNPNGIYYFGIGSSIKDLIRLLPENRHVFNARITRRNDGWTVTYRIPAELIRRLFPDFTLYSGKVMRANCYKCVEAGDAPHFLAWNPVPGEGLNFHRPHLFGKFIFE
ncbi:MAG: carbohydrate-binding family 9-like protein [Clostridia bacterium]|nr:carbohydrate-binding family 9-like protein [Clostridia bacterium]